MTSGPEKKPHTIPENPARPGCPDLFLVFAADGLIEVTPEEIEYHLRRREWLIRQEEKEKSQGKPS